jgi:rhodanese-related sulfurtransferase
MKSAFALRRASLAISLALAAPALLAQTQAPTRPISPPAAAAKPAVPPVTAPAVAPAAPVAGAATAPGALPPAAGAVPIDPNAPPPAPPPPPLSDIIFTNGDVITFDDKRPHRAGRGGQGQQNHRGGQEQGHSGALEERGHRGGGSGRQDAGAGLSSIAWGQMSRLGLYSVAAQLQSPPEGPVTDVPTACIRALRDWSKGELAQRFGWIDRLRLRRQPPARATSAVSRSDLDSVSRDKPVLVIHQSGRQVVANGKALELAGITRDSMAPPGGSIGRWPGSKEPDGVLEGAAAAALIGSPAAGAGRRAPGDDPAGSDSLPAKRLHHRRRSPRHAGRFCPLHPGRRERHAEA